MSMRTKQSLTGPGQFARVTQADSADLRRDGPLSFSFWLYVHSADSTHRGAVGFADGNSGYYFFMRDVSGTRAFSFYCREEPSTWRFIIWNPGSDPQPTFGVWTHIYCELSSGGTMKMFVDGIQRGGTASVSSADLHYNGATEFQIGRYDGICHATIADVAVWDKILSTRNIAQLQTVRQGIPLQIEVGGLLGYWPLTRFRDGDHIDSDNVRWGDWSKNQRQTDVREETDAKVVSTAGDGIGGTRFLSRPMSSIYMKRPPAAAVVARQLALMQVGS